MNTAKLSILEVIVLFMVFAYPIATFTVPISFGAIVVPAVLGLAMLPVLRPTVSRWEKYWLYLLCIFFLYVIVIMLLTYDDVHAIRELGFIFRLFLFFPFYYLLKHYQHYLYDVFLWMIILAGPIGLLFQNSQGGSINTHYMYFGFQTSAVFLLSAIMLSNARVTGIIKILLAISAICALVTTIRTGSRGAMVGTGFGVLFVLMTLLLQKKYKLLLLGFVSVAVIFSGSYMLAPDRAKQRYIKIMDNFSKFIHQNKITPNQEDYNSTAFRLKQWQLSIQLWQEKPLFGYGIGNFSQAMDMIIRKEKPKMMSPKIKYTNPHNNYFLLLVTLGIFGLIFGVMTWIIMPIILAYRSSNYEFKYSVIGFILLFFIFGMSDIWIFRSFAGFYLYLMGVLLVLTQDTKPIPKPT